MSEKRKDYTTAMEGYVMCLNQCATTVNMAVASAAAAAASSDGIIQTVDASGNIVSSTAPAEEEKALTISFMKELRGEVMLRIAVLKKEMGAVDQALQMCNTITSEPFSDSIRANALCLKVLLDSSVCLLTIAFNVGSTPGIIT